MKRLPYLVLIGLVMGSSTVAAKCLDRPDVSPECRYPQGDVWCAENNQGNPYAYSSKCLSAMTAQAQKKLPESVQEILKEMIDLCVAVDGKPEDSPGLLIVADLTGDSIPDFVIDQSAFNCNGAASLYSGSGGSQAIVYIGTKDGKAIEAFSHGNDGVKVNNQENPAKLMLLVGGPLCGEEVTDQTSRSEIKDFCWRPVVWNDLNRTLDFSPLSQIQPVQ